MTIQYEVVIWTIINFVLLYLVLNYLLFKPMLKVIDLRNAKIQNGKQRIADIEAESAQAEKAAATAAAANARQRQEAAAQEYDEAVKQCEEQRLSEEAASKMLFSARCDELKAEEERILASLIAGTPELAETVARKLTEKGL